MAAVRSGYEQQEKQLAELNHKLDESDKARRSELGDANQKIEQLTNQLRTAQGILDNQVPLPSIGGRSAKRTTGGTDNPLPTVDDKGQALPDTGPKIRVTTDMGEEGRKKSTGTGQTGTLASSSELARRREERKRITETVNIKKANPVTGQPDLYLPSGTILSGTLITGLDAPTSNQSRQDPFPALLRIKHEALLPNRYQMDIAECFVIASGYGDLSAERAYLRAERLSCIKKDGTVIETPMDAYSVGEDGKTGIRGRLVSKNGQLIANALMSGFVAGLGKAFTPQRIQPLSLDPGQTTQFQYPSPEMVAGQSIGGGVNGAAEQLASYYLEMAKNIFPIVEIDAGRKVDMILVRGMALVGKSRSSAILTDRGATRAVAAGSYSSSYRSNQSGGLAGFGLGGLGGNTSSNSYR